MLCADKGQFAGGLEQVTVTRPGPTESKAVRDTRVMLHPAAEHMLKDPGKEGIC